MKCPTCGGATEHIRGDWQFREGGLEGVTLKNVEIIRCRECGDAPVIPRFGELMDVLATAIARKTTPLAGREVRFLREHAELSPEQLAAVLGIEPAQIATWERGDEPV